MVIRKRVWGMMPGGAISFSESEENIIVRFLF